MSDPHDPEFGVDPEDSARLLELRDAIDNYFGWKNQANEEAGDYVARVKEVGIAIWEALINHPGDAGAMQRVLRSVLISPHPSVAVVAAQKLPPNIDVLRGKCIRLEEQLRRQRKELRRFNRDARVRAEGRDGDHLTSISLERTFSEITAERIEEVIAMMPPSTFYPGDRVQCIESETRSWVGATGTIVWSMSGTSGAWVPDRDVPDELIVLSFSEVSRFTKSAATLPLGSPEQMHWVRDRRVEDIVASDAAVANEVQGGIFEYKP